MTVVDVVKGCYGCGACKNICPVNAINMVEDEYGFLKAVIDKNACVNCERCTAVCPRFHNEYDNIDKPECYAAWAKNEIRSTCASGGIFTAIAADFLKIGGAYIAGAIWDKDYHVKHIITDRSEDIANIQNSKYVQSSTEQVYSNIQLLLSEGRKVLFCGTPCQVAGLYSFLGGKAQNLYTMDLICHGVPSQKILTKYLKDQYKAEDIERINFRDKSVFGWSSEINIYFKNSTEFHKRALEDSFYQAFLSNMSLNPICESCQFSKVPRQGDITLGDFWGIEKYKENLNDGLGTSLVLLNNEKGKILFESCASIEMKEKVPFEFLKNTCNKTIFEPFRHHYGSMRFLREFQRINFAKAVEQCKSFKYDIGLVTTWFARNFGAIFTAYALYRILEKMGYTVLMINKPKELWGEMYNAPNRSTIALDFGKRHYYISKEYSLDTMPYIGQLNNNCEIFIAGSDQLWNPKVYAYKYYFFLDFVESQNKKISYATSVGSQTFQGTLTDKHFISYLLKRFDLISNREDEAVKICEDEFGLSSTRVIDPVFLLEQEDYNLLEIESNVNYETEYIFAYILDGNLEKKRIIDELSIKLGMHVLCAYDLEHPEQSKEYLGYEEARIDKPEDWLWYIKNASYVITDSYHGGCFSLIYQKQFICFVNSLRGEARFKELFGRLGLAGNLVFTEHTDFDIDNVLNNPIQYDNVNRILHKEKIFSYEWLDSAVKKQPNAMNEEEFILNSVRRERYIEKNNPNQLRIFSNINQLGCGPDVSVQKIIDTMPENSYLQQVQGNMTPIIDTPVPYGVLTIKKTTYYFVEVQFSQITYKHIMPIMFIANVIDGKVEKWEKFVSHSELNTCMESFENRIKDLTSKIDNLQQYIDTELTKKIDVEKENKNV